MIRGSTQNYISVSAGKAVLKWLEVVAERRKSGEALDVFADGPSKVTLIARIQFCFVFCIFVRKIPEYEFCLKLSISYGLGLENGCLK